MRFLAVVLMLTASSTSLATEIAYFRGNPERLAANRGPEPPEEWFPRLVLRGEIALGDDKRLADALKQANKEMLEWWKIHPQLQLNSPGGDVKTAMAIGRLARNAQLITIVPRNGLCASACVLVLAGGVRRYAEEGSRIGLHRPYFADTRSATAAGYNSFERAYTSVLDTHRAYFAEMRIASTLLDQMSQVPSNEVRWMDQATAKRIGLLGEDAVHSEWNRATATANRGAACVAWSDKYFACVVRLGAGILGVLKRCEMEAGPTPAGCD